jgi:nucleotide-binding universal stress UspA family protein
MYAETEARKTIRPAKTVDQVEGEHRVRAERALQATIAELGDEVPVEVDAYAEDDPAEVLLRVSEHLDLLACGSRGYGPVRAVLLGGVSRRVAAEARCPVIVLPRGVRASLEALLAETAAT